MRQGESLKAIDRPGKVSLQHFAINAVLNSLLLHKRPCKLLFFLFIIWLHMHTSEFHSSRRWLLSLSKAARIQTVLFFRARCICSYSMEISYNKTGRGKFYALWYEQRWNHWSGWSQHKVTCVTNTVFDLGGIQKLWLLHCYIIRNIKIKNMITVLS